MKISCIPTRRKLRPAIRQNSIDFHAINRAAISQSRSLVEHLLPDGSMRGQEYVARNPHRTDRHLGSFSVNTTNGKWADFATGDQGGDFISLYAFVRGLPQGEAARQLAELIGVHHG